MIASRGGTKEPLITIEDVSFSYEGGAEALKRVTVRLFAGEYVAIVGGNGSGKTTLAKHLNGLLSPSSGRVLVGQTDTRNASVASLSRTVGYVFQNPDHQLFRTSVEEELRFGPQNMGFNSEKESALVERAIKLMGIDHLRERSPVSLNLGDRRKVTIASVLATSPRVLVLDEPTTGLDSGESDQLMRALRALHSEGVTIVLITHEMKLVSQHVDRVIVMSSGAVALDADVATVFSDSEVLGKCRLIAPPVTLLAQRLKAKGLISQSAATPHQLLEGLSRSGGGGL